MISNMDTLTPMERSERMGRVRAKDTKPELIVRRLVHALGYRYRLHQRELPGCPDLCFGPRRKVIFVHGCFWHRHNCNLGNRTPKTRVDFWQPKLEANRQRDRQHQAALKSLGWQILIVWECELAHEEHLQNRLVDFLEGHENAGHRTVRRGGRPRHRG
jgi:DNA mismatch endonuclease (patch repair protein)